MSFVSDPKSWFSTTFLRFGDHEIDESFSYKKIHHENDPLIEHKVSKLEEFVDRLAVMHEGQIICCGECQATLNTRGEALLLETGQLTKQGK